MKKESNKMSLAVCSHKNGKIFLSFLFSFLVLCSGFVFAQSARTITGRVLDEQKQPLVGVTVVVKGQAGGTFTDAKGAFSLRVPAGDNTLLVTYIGMQPQEIELQDQNHIVVVLKEMFIQLEETIVVGYGQQRKESVVGAISQTQGAVLERAGGVSSVGAAMTGNIPGVITTATRGTPGDEDPKIYIRGQSTWNNSDPLVLVDGIERPMGSVDISSVESISVLKDASATAVFGVKGANGVILITTKRGREGKADISIGASATMKVPSKLPNKLDSYDALKLRNVAIERELGLYPSSWGSFTPQAELNKYRYPANLEESERYPNVDWADELFKSYGMAYNAHVNVSGGTSFVKYFAGVDYQHEGDVFRSWQNNKSYTPGYEFNRINVRSNLDFQITSSTTLTANLFGSYGDRQDTWGNDDWEYRMWQGAYGSPPDVYIPQYSDGSWGVYPPNEVGTVNSAKVLAMSGVRNTTTTRINTDFTLAQDLSMLVDGLNLKATISMDNTFRSRGGKYDSGGDWDKYIDPVTGEVQWKQFFGTNQFDYMPSRWDIRPDESFAWDTGRKLFYQFQINYAKKIGRHNVTAMGLFSRDEKATGSEFPHYREDWVFRATYDFDTRYFVEFNGAYNGSEKFSSSNRFDFFPSVAAGWMLSEEKFMRNIKFLDMLKIRGSYGQVGDDNIWQRWLYMTQWAYGGKTRMGERDGEESPYVWYKQSQIGNPDIRWEKVTKTNLGVDVSFLNGLVALNFDYFRDVRKDILLSGGGRAIPSYYGADAPVANLGKVRVKGYELEVRLDKRFANGMRLWGNANMTHSKDKILDADNPSLLESYKKSEGKQIGQSYTHLDKGYYNTWDEVYGSTILNTYDHEKLPGNLHMLDFNGDGVIDDYDSVPYGYPDRPQNTFNATIGFDYKGFSAFVQFYGVTNVTRLVAFNSFGGNLNTAYDQGSTWSKDNPNAKVPVPRWNSHMSYKGSVSNYDGSYIRLKNAEISYTFDKGWVKKLGIKSLRVFLNGNNLWLWTKMPDDRESNLGSWASQGAYPTVRRFNLGINIVL